MAIKRTVHEFCKECGQVEAELRGDGYLRYLPHNHGHRDNPAAFPIPTPPVMFRYGDTPESQEVIFVRNKADYKPADAMKVDSSQLEQPKKVSIEEMVRQVLQAVKEDEHLASLYDRIGMKNVHPARFTAGDLAGPANRLARLLSQNESMREATEMSKSCDNIPISENPPPPGYIPPGEWEERIAENEVMTARRTKSWLDNLRQTVEGRNRPMTLPSVINYMPPNSYGRPVEVSFYQTYYKGMFHGFFNGEGEEGPIAIVEHEDGSISTVYASVIKFLPLKPFVYPASSVPPKDSQWETKIAPGSVDTP